MSDTSFTGRTLQGGVDGIKGGGTCYWGCIIYPNDEDDWYKFVFANIPSYTWSNINWGGGVLLDISAIDFRGDLLKDPLAKISDVTITLENLSGYYDDLVYTDGVRFTGRKAEIIIGSDTEVTDSNYAVVMTGKVLDTKQSRQKIFIKIRGKSQLQNKMVGEVQSSDYQHKDSQGKILSIVHGDWTDKDAYIPTIISRDFDNIPEFMLEDKKLKSYDSLWVWDKGNEIGYKAKSDDTQYYVFYISGTYPGGGSDPDPVIPHRGDQYTHNSTTYELRRVSLDDYTPSKGDSIDGYVIMEKISGSNAPSDTGTLTIVDPETGQISLSFSQWSFTHQYSIASDNNKITSIVSLGINLTASINESDDEIIVSNYKMIFYWAAKDLTESVPPTILKIHDELLYVFGQPTSNTIKVERGYGNTTPASHGGGATIYQIDQQDAKSRIYVEHQIYPIQIGGTDIDDIGTPGFTITLTGKILYILDRDNDFKVSGTITPSHTLNRYTLETDLIFPKISIGDEILVMHVLSDCEAYVNGTIIDESSEMRAHITIKEDGTSKKEIVHISRDASGSETDTFNNISGSNRITEVDMYDTTYLVQQMANSTPTSVTTIDEFNEKRWSILWAISSENCSAVTEYVQINSLGFNIGFLVDPEQEAFYYRAEGREHPGTYGGESYFHGSATDLIEEPQLIIEDIGRRELLLTSSDMEESFFDEVHGERSSWKMASLFYENPIAWRNILKELAFNSGIVTAERYNGKLAVIVTDIPEDGDFSRTIAESEIETDSKGNAIWDYDITPMSELITRLDLRYKPIIPRSNSYRGVKFCQRTDLDGDDNNFTTEGSEYSSLLQMAYNELGEERKLTVNANHIRDAATAENLAKNYIRWHYRQLAILKITCTYSVIDIEQWTKVKTNLSFLPTNLNSRYWITQSVKIVPNINGKTPRIELTLLEFPTDLPESPELPDAYDEGEGAVDSSSWDAVDEGEGVVDSSTWDAEDEGEGAL